MAHVTPDTTAATVWHEVVPLAVAAADPFVIAYDRWAELERAINANAAEMREVLATEPPGCWEYSEPCIFLRDPEPEEDGPTLFKITPSTLAEALRSDNDFGPEATARVREFFRAEFRLRDQVRRRVRRETNLGPLNDESTRLYDEQAALEKVMRPKHPTTLRGVALKVAWLERLKDVNLGQVDVTAGLIELAAIASKIAQAETIDAPDALAAAAPSIA